MRVFKDVGLVERLGSGMSRILKAYDRNIFEISEHFIKVIFPFFKEEEDKNIAIKKEFGDDNGDEMMILQILEEEPDITAKN